MTDITRQLADKALEDLIDEAIANGNSVEWANNQREAVRAAYREHPARLWIDVTGVEPGTTHMIAQTIQHETVEFRFTVSDVKQAAPAAEPTAHQCSECGGMGYVDGIGDACQQCAATGTSQPPSGELPPAGVMQPVPELVWPATCDGKEQEAFEAWAVSQKHNMSMHPLHYLFLNNEAYAARQAWKAGLIYAVDQMRAAIASKQADTPAVTITFGDTGTVRKMVIHDQSVLGSRVDLYRRNIKD